MVAILARLVPARWRQLPARSARLRLTLAFSGMFLALGTVVVAIIFALVWGGGTIVGSSSQSVTAVPSGHGPAVHAIASQQHSADQARLVAVSWLTLAFTAVAALPLGWFAAGRVLRPLRDMTATARTISAGNLHQRLALSGPDDEFKQLGDTVDDLLARLEAAFAAQRRFVANAAHELRTPLTLERTLLQVALADANASATSLRATCEELIASGRNQERLLDALLTLASSERGLDRREGLDLASLAQRVLVDLQPEIDGRLLELSTELAPAGVVGDPALVERLIANLLDNAVRHNRVGGWIQVRSEAAASRAILTVANSGAPIPDDAVERLFEPFQRLHGNRIEDNGHHGLGLSIARAIATAHEATITADSRAAGGLSVTVSFPAPEAV
jgi:signal transduction histidine kinase